MFRSNLSSTPSVSENKLSKKPVEVVDKLLLVSYSAYFSTLRMERYVAPKR
jgi:hypothetical protein